MFATSNICTASRHASLATHSHGSFFVRIRWCALSSGLSPPSVTIHYSRTSHRVGALKQQQQQQVNARCETVVHPTSSTPASSSSQERGEKAEASNSAAQNPEDGVGSLVEELLKKFPEKVSQESVIRRNVSALLELNVSTRQIYHATIQNPFLLSPGLPDSIKLAFECLHRWGLTDTDIARVLARYPHLLSHDMRDIRAALNFLTAEIGIRNVRSFISSNPYFFGRHLPSMRAKADSIRDLGLARVLQKAPMLLNYSVDDIVVKANYFKELMGEEKMIGVMTKLPTLMTMRVETVQETYDNLCAVFGKENVLPMIDKHPGVIQKTWPTISSKILFVVETMGRDLDEIYHCPSVFTYSLEQRMKPRYEALDALGLGQRYGLSSMFCPTDRDFFIRFGVSPLPNMNL